MHLFAEGHCELKEFDVTASVVNLTAPGQVTADMDHMPAETNDGGDNTAVIRVQGYVFVPDKVEEDSVGGSR